MKKKTSVIKDGFYKKYLNDQKPTVSVNTEKDKPEYNSGKVFFSVLGAIVRFIMYTLLFVLSSIGLTALINQEIRVLLYTLLT